MKRVEGKVAIVTGASSGIGKAIAELFAKEGAKVVLADHNTTRGPQVEEEIRRAGGEAMWVNTDTGVTADLERVVKATIDKYGRIDILVNNAGIAGEPDDLINEEIWRRVVDVNFNGPFLLSHMVVPYMKKQGGGNIVNISSTGGLHATGRSTVYSATKGGLNMITRNMARALGKDNIRVNCVAPSQIETPIWWKTLEREPTQEEVERERIARAAPAPMGRVGTAEEVAYPVLFLASDEASFITGAILTVDGGVWA